MDSLKHFKKPFICVSLFIFGRVYATRSSQQLFYAYAFFKSSALRKRLSVGQKLLLIPSYSLFIVIGSQQKVVVNQGKSTVLLGPGLLGLTTVYQIRLNKVI